MTAAGNGYSAPPQSRRVDLNLVADLIRPGSRVLDIGCGDGTLLEILENRYGIDGRGVELSQRNVNECVAKGLAVVQGDADRDLVDYPDNAFDYVVLSQTIQATRDPRGVLDHILRIGRRGVVSFPNFGHWRMRWQLLTRGRMPITEHLPVSWYATPNIHFCTIRDFCALADDMGVVIEKVIALGSKGDRLSEGASLRTLNLFGEQAIFVLAKPR
ncbi:methionine biosynthesis protein MetW [Microbaculum sp. FT89]|uniref:methionine biosynthesis protein MetW n=1 Tax=Microbaculum sp. FT89 TaxID=3447298 RepID=UPI003F53A782